MPEAVVILFLEVAKLSLELALDVSRGQPQDVKEKMWQWHVKDMERIRKWIKLDD